MKQQWQRYKEMELISDDLLQSQTALVPVLNQPRSNQNAAADSSNRLTQSNLPTKHISWLRAIWNAIDIALLRNLEPRIWQTTDPQSGKLRWHLYNPSTGKTDHLNSDAEVRDWLEQNFRY